MLYLIALYSMLSALSVVIALIHHKLVVAFCIAILSLCAVRGGSELRYFFAGDLLQKIGRLAIALVLIVVSVHLSLHYDVNLFVLIVSGTAWSVLGIVVGLCTTSTGPRRRARMKV